MKSAIDRSKNYLYFLKTVEGPVKIGRTHDLDQRIGQIATACPLEIDWVIGWRGKGDGERAWHLHFADQRLRGEWFAWSDDLDAAIKAGRLPHPEPDGDAYDRMFAPKPPKQREEWDFDRFMAHSRTWRPRLASPPTKGTPHDPAQ